MNEWCWYLHGISQPSVLLTCTSWNMLQNEKCHLLVEHETQKLKALDESHNQNLKEWQDKLRPRKKVTLAGLVGSASCCAIGVCLGYGYRYRYGYGTDLWIYLKELACPVVGTVKPEICRADCRLESQGRVDVAALSPRAVWRPNPSFFSGTSVFLLRPATEWGPTTFWRVSCFIQSTELNVNHI